MPPPKRRDRDSINSNGSCTGSTTGSTVTGGTVISAPPPPPPPASMASTAGAVAAATITTSAVTTSSNSIVEPKDQELFLQAFEKPTQIYRFLRQRHDSNPIFLNRTLSYMKERMSRTNKKRATFKVDSLLETITQKSKCISNNFLSIIYTALYDKGDSELSCWKCGDKVTVESILFRITKSKRKDSTADFQEVLRHSSVVTYCPQVEEGPYSTISIPVQNVCPFGDQHTVYKLLFRIQCEANGKNTSLSDVSGNVALAKRPKLNAKAYGCELLILERNIGCVAEGDYEAALQEINAVGIKTFSPKKRSWEALPKNYFPQKTKFDAFNYIPTLKFRLVWTSTEIPPTIDSRNINSYGRRGEFIEHTLSNGMTIEPNTDAERINEHTINVNHNNNCIKGHTNENGTIGSMAGGIGVNNRNSVRGEKIQIIYNFLYNNNTRQQTEYTQEVICPWCSLGCLRLYSLLKHLKLCHARFNFTYQPTSDGARIDVTINDSYDGSYSGSPHDLVGPSGCSFARTCGPVRRTSVTNLLVCRPRRQKTCLDEFMELDEDDLNNQRCYITGHNRLYHHTETCLPVHPKELDIDSEGESDPLWLRQKTIQMIDEFSDVNEGEKELMKLWNLHVMKYGYVGDCQIPLACEMFLNANGETIISKNLYRNFILHLCSLFDYGLCSAETVYKTVQKLQSILSKYPEGQEMMSQQRAKQVKYWLDVGIHKQDEQKLKSPQKSNLNGGNCHSSTISNSHNNHHHNLLHHHRHNNNQDNNTKITASNGDTKPMHPPTKRTANTIKQRMSGMQHQHQQQQQKGLNSGGSNKLLMPPCTNKIAKKSVIQLDEINGTHRASTNANAKSDRDRCKGRHQESAHNGVKRKLSLRDMAPSQSSSKRRRRDSITTAIANATASTTTTTTISATSNSTTSSSSSNNNNGTISNDNSNCSGHHTLSEGNHSMHTVTATTTTTTIALSTRSSHQHNRGDDSSNVKSLTQQSQSKTFAGASSSVGSLALTSSSSTSTSSLGTLSNVASTTPLPKRVSARRTSMSNSNSNEVSNFNNSINVLNSNSKLNGGNTIERTHSLRKRNSLPARVDKR